MVVLSRIEAACGGDFRHDRAIETLLPMLFRFARGPLLLGRVIKNRRPVLGAYIRSLAVQRGGIVQLPEVVEQLVVGNLCRIEGDLNGLGVTCFVSTHVAVSGIFGRA